MFRYFTIRKEVTAQQLQLLNSSLIGTPGKVMVYRQIRVEEKIKGIPDPLFVNLERGNQMVGTATFCKRVLPVGTLTTSSYIRYFSFLDNYRSKTGKNRETKGNSILRKEIKNLLDLGSIESPGNYFSYAYLDPGNIRSKRLCTEFGFTKIRNFETFIFHRSNPQPFPNVEIAQSEDIPTIRKKLSDFYSGYNLFTSDNLFNRGNYYVFRNNAGEIIAGVNAVPDEWEIHQLQGWISNVFLNVFPYLPYLKTLINKRYKFLALDGLFYTDEDPDILNRLIEAVLRSENYNIALLAADTDSGLNLMIRKLRLGLVNKLKRPVRAEIIGRLTQLSGEKQTILIKNPAYVSVEDFV